MIYLDNAATTYPKPYETLKEYDECVRSYAANAGRGGHKMSIRASEKIYETREALAKIFGIPTPDRIAFTYNATMSLNMGLKGVLGEGDSAIISSMEHNSVYRPIMGLSDKGVELRISQADKFGFTDAADIEKNISDNTKLICITHVSNVTGAVNDICKIGEVARRHGIIFMVDASQSAGSIDIDVVRDNIDILAFPGHKGLLGLQGTGGLYVKEGLRLKTIIEGGTGSKSESPYQPEFMPDALESGTVNLPGIASLYGGLCYISARGTEDIAAHERNMAAALYDRLSEAEGIKVLSPHPFNGGSGIVSFVPHKLTSAEVAAELDKKYGIAVRAGYHCSYLGCKTVGAASGGCVRLSVGPFTTLCDIMTASSAVRDICNF